MKASNSNFGTSLANINCQKRRMRKNQAMKKVEASVMDIYINIFYKTVSSPFFTISAEIIEIIKYSCLKLPFDAKILYYR